MRRNLLFTYIFIFNLIACEQWDYDRIDFVQVNTGELQEIDFLSAKVEGNLAGLKNGVVNKYGHVWADEDELPDISNPDHVKTDFGERASNGSFSSELTNLQMNTTYQVRAYAQEGEHIVYGEVQNFTTLDLIISIDIPEDQDPTSQQIQGNILGPSIPISGNLELRLPITQHGFCWSTENEVPTLHNDKKLDLGILREYGAFETTLSDLATETNFYVRTYAVIRQRDTFYSEEVGLFHSFDAGVGWERMADFPGEPRSRAFFLEIQSKGYVGGGLFEQPDGLDPNTGVLDYWEFDPITNSWTEKGSIPNQYWEYSDFSFVIRDTAYLSLDRNDFYTLTSANVWRQLLQDEFSGDRLGFSIGDKGYITSSGSEDSIWVFDPSMPIADNLKPIALRPVKEPTRTILSIESEGKAYFIFLGGSIWSFEPDLLPNTPWKNEGSSGGFPIAYSFTSHNKGYIVKEDTQPPYPMMKVWQLDPNSMSGERLKRMPDMPSYIKLSDHFTIDGKIYIGLGQGIEGIFDPNVGYIREFWRFIPPE